MISDLSSAFTIIIRGKVGLQVEKEGHHWEDLKKYGVHLILYLSSMSRKVKAGRRDYEKIRLVSIQM